MASRFGLFVFPVLTSGLHPIVRPNALCRPLDWTRRGRVRSPLSQKWVVSSRDRASISRSGTNNSHGGGILPRQDLMKAAIKHEVPREVAVHVLDIAEKAIRNRSMEVTDFLRAPERIGMMMVIEKLAIVKVLPFGGYPQAERQKLAFAIPELGLLSADEEGHDSLATSGVREAVALVELRGNFLFDAANHRDFLGAILGLGIEREKIGDIIVLGDRGAQVLCTPELAQYISDGVTRVRSVPIQGRILPLDQLEVREPLKKPIQSVEASLRVDAVASAGFSTSRTKMNELVKNGEVLVNYREVSSASKELKAGDTVTVRGKGRLEIEEVQTTAKGRFRIKMMRYI